MLVRSAHSANIKERRDCSMRAVRPGRRDGHAGRAHPRAPRRDARRGRRRARRGRTRPDVAWVLNDPYRGGTHLPDITVITPVFADDGTLLGFAASRAHHADVGGPTPGSMPADSTTLDDEGVVIAPRRLDDAAIDELRRADAPARPAPRRPARAARRQPRGRRAAARAARRAAALRAATAEVLDYAERRMRACLPSCPTARAAATDVLEAREGDLELRLDGDRATATS